MTDLPAVIAELRRRDNVRNQWIGTLRDGLRASDDFCSHAALYALDLANAAEEAVRLRAERDSLREQLASEGAAANCG